MTPNEKKLEFSLGLYLGVSVVYIICTLAKRKKISKRIKRYEAFRAESEQFMMKYENVTDKEAEEKAVAEFIEIMNRHGM
jgi:hypothetical protein